MFWVCLFFFPQYCIVLTPLPSLGNLAEKTENKWGMSVFKVGRRLQGLAYGKQCKGIPFTKAGTGWVGFFFFCVMECLKGYWESIAVETCLSVVVSSTLSTLTSAPPVDAQLLGCVDGILSASWLMSLLSVSDLNWFSSKRLLVHLLPLKKNKKTTLVVCNWINAVIVLDWYW